MNAPDFPLPNGYLWQYDFLRWLESSATPNLDKIMKWLSMIGLDTSYMVAALIILWSVHKTVGLRLGYVFFASMFANEWLKEFLSIVRPVGVPGLRSVYVESPISVYGLPSGHAQGSMTFWVFIAKWAKRRWLWPLVVLLALVIGFSRLYLGLHWPSDALVGWAIGLLFALFGWGIGAWWTYRGYGFQTRLTFAIGIPLALFLVHRGITSAEYAALLFGFGVGAVLEEKYLSSAMDEVLWKRVCAGIIGIAGFITLKWVIKWPVDNTLWATIQYLLIGFWATLGAPYVFSKSGLYQRGEPIA